MQVPNPSYSVLRETNNECSSLPSLIAQAICRASTGAAERGTRSMPANGDDRNAGVRRTGPRYSVLPRELVQVGQTLQACPQTGCVGHFSAVVTWYSDATAPVSPRLTADCPHCTNAVYLFVTDNRGEPRGTSGSEVVTLPRPG